MVDISVYKRNLIKVDGLQLFSDAARQFGLDIKGSPNPDGQVHRCPDNNAGKRNKDTGWYVLQEADGVWFGAYGSWVRESVKFCSHTAESLTPIQRQHVKEAQEAAQQRAEQLKAQAARIADAANEDCPPADPNHPYLVKKKISPCGALQKDDLLLLPAQTIQGEITTYQTISPTGEKRFLKGGNKKGSYFQIGSLSPTLYLCEGFATGATIHEATGSCVFVAFDRTSLGPVAAALRTIYTAPIVICADNDQFTDGNPGLTDANSVAATVANCRVVFPVFNDLSTKPTDFNDLCSLEGIMAVQAQINKRSGKELKLLYADDIHPVTDTSDFVEDLLRDNEFSVIYGESNCGKTFYMMDLALHVALGTPWRGKQVEQGGVIYAALEGGHGTKNRIVAFREHYKIKESIPLAVIPSNLNFLDADGDIKALAAAISEAKERLGSVRLIVIDTLARAISGGDENSSMDMGQLIINADVLRGITGAHIAFIHHSGKDALKGARGHSSLRAAVDTEIEISRPDTESPSLIRVVKQREMEMIEDMSFNLKPVILGKNSRGKDVTSCVVVPTELVRKERTHTLSAVQQFLYDSLLQALINYGMNRNIIPGSAPVNTVSYEDLRLVMEERGFREMMATENKTSEQQLKSATQNARLSLKKMGKINFNQNYLWLSE